MKLLSILSLFLLSFVFPSNAQIQNGGFEDLNVNGNARFWTAKTYNMNVYIDQDGHSHSDSVVFDKTNYSISGSAFSGTKALELRNGFNFTTGKALPGIVFASSDTNNYSGFASRFIELSSNPDDISLYYNFTQVGGDTAYVSVSILDENMIEIGHAEALIVTSSNGYKALQIPIVYQVQGNAAYASIEIGTAKPDANAHLGTVLLVDDVKMAFNTAIDNVHSNDLVTFCPNPAVDNFRMKTSKAVKTSELKLIDMKGQVITISPDADGVYDVGNVSEGINVVLVSGAASNYKYKLVVRR